MDKLKEMDRKVFIDFNANNDGLKILKDNGFEAKEEKSGVISLFSGDTNTYLDWDESTQRAKVVNQGSSSFRERFVRIPGGNEGYDAFEIWTVLEHGNNRNRAVYEASREGHGDTRYVAEGFTQERYEKMLKKSTIDINEKPTNPKPLLLMNGSDHFSVGKMSSVVSGSGHGKSTLTTFLAAELIKNKNKETFNSFLGSGKVLIFETEMDKYDAWKRIKAIQMLTGSTQISKRVEVRYLTEFASREDRRKFILTDIERTAAQFIIIDGVADLFSSINDEGPARDTAQQLAQLALKHKKHILSVIHSSDKSGSKEAMGWLGTIWKQKVQTEMNITNKGDRFEVTYGKFRHGKKPAPWNLTIEVQDSIPLPVFQKSTRSSNDDLLSYYEDEAIVKEIFSSILDEGDYTNAQYLASEFNKRFKDRFEDAAKDRDDVRKDILKGGFDFLIKNGSKFEMKNNQDD